MTLFAIGNKRPTVWILTQTGNNTKLCINFQASLGQALIYMD